MNDKPALTLDEVITKTETVIIRLWDGMSHEMREALVHVYAMACLRRIANKGMENPHDD